VIALVTVVLTGTGVLLLSSRGSDQPARGLGPDQRRRADAVISVFEHSTIEMGYGAVEELNDGRGITVGRAGFTSATGDLVLVIRRYVSAHPASTLGEYLVTLERLAADQSGDTTGLAGFPEAWREAAHEPALRAAQDGVVEELYYRPAMDRAEQVGATLPLTLAILYDTAIQHGDGPDPDGLAALISETTGMLGGDPAAGVGEERWTRTFLDVRRRHLADAADPATRRVWAQSVDRVDALRDLLDGGADALDAPFVLDVQGGTFRIP
jgi:chitosanase